MRGVYHPQLLTLLGAYPRSQVLVLEAGELQLDTNNTLQRVWEFLGVERVPAPTQEAMYQRWVLVYPVFMFYPPPLLLQGAQDCVHNILHPPPLPHTKCAATTGFLSSTPRLRRRRAGLFKGRSSMGMCPRWFGTCWSHCTSPLTRTCFNSWVAHSHGRLHQQDPVS